MIKIKSISGAAASGPLFQIVLFAALLGFGAYFDHEAALVASSPAYKEAGDAVRGNPSAEVLRFARWAVESRDSSGLPFIVVDKTRARLFAFDSAGRIRASTPVLLGSSTGDDAAEAVTPAGRFVTDSQASAKEEGIVWANAEAAVALHAMPSERSPGRGLQRLASGRVEDKRISDGSLHVSGDFYREYLSALRTQASVAYVLPEVLPVQQVFSFLDAAREATRIAQGRIAPRRPS